MARSPRPQWARTDQDRWRRWRATHPRHRRKVAGLSARRVWPARPAIGCCGLLPSEGRHLEKQRRGRTFTNRVPRQPAVLHPINDNQDPDTTSSSPSVTTPAARREVHHRRGLPGTVGWASEPSDWTIIETLPEYDAILKQTISARGRCSGTITTGTASTTTGRLRNGAAAPLADLHCRAWKSTRSPYRERASESPTCLP